MKLHQTVIDRLVRMLDLFGGRHDNNRLVAELKNLDLSIYQQKENPEQKSFIVLTEDLQPKPK